VPNEARRYYNAARDITTAILVPSPWNIARAVTDVARLVIPASKPHRLFSGDINLDTGTVDICTVSPYYCKHHKLKSATLNAQLSSYLQGTGPAPTRKRAAYIIGEIDKANEMRLRPLTSTELNAWGQTTPASQALMQQAYGARGGRRSAKKRRGTKKKRAVRVRRSARPRRVKRAKRAHLVRGSVAAKRHMARLRGMARRRK